MCMLANWFWLGLNVLYQLQEKASEDEFAG